MLGIENAGGIRSMDYVASNHREHGPQRTRRPNRRVVHGLSLPCREKSTERKQQSGNNCCSRRTPNPANEHRHKERAENASQEETHSPGDRNGQKVVEKIRWIE